MSIKPSFKTITVGYKVVFVLSLIWVSAVAGCASMRTPLDPIDSDLYASGTAYTYQPLNPTTVWIRDPTAKEIKDGHLDADETSNDFKKALLRDLDTEAVRIALNTLGGDAKFSAGVVGASVAGESYVLFVDYIKYFASSKIVDIDYKVINAKGIESKKQFKGTVPIYIGIGLRIRAEFQAHKSGLNISGLPAIAFAANSNGISGRLTVQTLGITGQEVTGLMPIISDISIASIQSAVQAVAAIKAKIYEDSTTVYPKIVGFETPSQDPVLIRAITEKIYASQEWICPVIKEVKNLQGKTENILWIDWDSPYPSDENK